MHGIAGQAALERAAGFEVWAAIPRGAASSRSAHQLSLRAVFADATPWAGEVPFTDPVGLAGCSSLDDALTAVADDVGAQLAAIGVFGAGAEGGAARRILTAQRQAAVASSQAVMPHLAAAVGGGALLVVTTGEAGDAVEAAVRVVVVHAALAGTAAPAGGGTLLPAPTAASGAADFTAGPTLRGCLLRGLDALAIFARAAAVGALLRALLLPLLLRLDGGEATHAPGSGEGGAEQGATRAGQVAEQVVELVAIHGHVSESDSDG